MQKIWDNSWKFQKIFLPLQPNPFERKKTNKLSSQRFINFKNTYFYDRTKNFCSGRKLL